MSFRTFPPRPPPSFAHAQPLHSCPELRNLTPAGGVLEIRNSRGCSDACSLSCIASRAGVPPGPAHLSVLRPDSRPPRPPPAHRPSRPPRPPPAHRPSRARSAPTHGRLARLPLTGHQGLAPPRLTPASTAPRNSPAPPVRNHSPAIKGSLLPAPPVRNHGFRGVTTRAAQRGARRERRRRPAPRRRPRARRASAWAAAPTRRACAATPPPAPRHGWLEHACLITAAL